MPRVRTVPFQVLICALFLLLTSSLMAQSVTFLAGQNFQASQSDTGVNLTVEGDFNGDGKPDLITMTFGAHDATLSILLGNGDGTFQPPATIIPAATFYNNLVVGDFNGDGHLDLAALPNNTNSFAIFLGNGDGTFQAPLTTTLQAPPTLEKGMVAADFNGDGKTDLALSANAPQQGNSTVLVLISNGDGTFQAPVPYSVTGAQVNLLIGDFNGDGKPDLLTTALTVLLGNGDGTFQAPKTNSLSCGNPKYIALADFNNDGKDDLALTGAVALSNGDGTFTPVCNTLDGINVTADFNNDGLPDLATLPIPAFGTGVTIYLGKGDGTFQPPYTFYSSLNTTGGRLNAFDFDGDGNIDLAGPGTRNNVTVVHGNGDGTFRAATFVGTQNDSGIGFDFVSFTTTDLRSNGINDFILFGYSQMQGGTVATILGNGNGTFQGPVPYTAPTFTSGGAVGDFNNDGKPDLASGAALGGSSLGVLLGQGNGTFSGGATYSDGGGVPQVGDFNGDGNEDIVVGSDLFLGNGTGTFGFPVTINVTGIVADVNGDGLSDFVSSAGNNIDVYLNLGNLNFQLVQTPINENVTPLGLADLNHDGKLDLVAGGAGGLVILLGNGDGTFQLKGTFPAPVTGSVAFGDFNGDGKLDVATAGNGTTVSVMLGNGDGTLQPAVNYDSGPGNGTIYNVVAADFNGDGKIDLATMNPLGVVILFNTVGLSPGVSFNPNSLNFASQGVGSTSPAQKIVLQNTGGTTLTISQIAISGLNSGDFAQTNNCGSSLAPNASCTISVTFTPTASGSRAASLSVTDSTGNQKVPLTGTGAPSLGLGIPSGSSNSATVNAGDTANYTLAIGGGGLSGTATLSCSGAPSGAICSVPASENVNANSGTQFTVADGWKTAARSPKNRTPLVRDLADTFDFVWWREQWRRFNGNTGRHLHFDRHGHDGQHEAGANPEADGELIGLN